jgi:hypothetical protein
MPSPPQVPMLTLPVPRLTTEPALADAHAELLAAGSAARRLLDVLTAFERDHGDWPICQATRFASAGEGTTRRAAAF